MYCKKPIYFIYLSYKKSSYVGCYIFPKSYYYKPNIPFLDLPQTYTCPFLFNPADKWPFANISYNSKF